MQQPPDSKQVKTIARKTAKWAVYTSPRASESRMWSEFGFESEALRVHERSLFHPWTLKACRCWLETVLYKSCLYRQNSRPTGVRRSFNFFWWVPYVGLLDHPSISSMAQVGLQYSRLKKPHRTMMGLTAPYEILILSLISPFSYLWGILIIWCLFSMKNDKFTTPPQQLHNTPSHGVGPSVWSSPPCEEVLCTCCGGVV
jgi:hypothetical protein